MKFVYFYLTGKDSEKFLQGQLTCDTKQVSDDYLPCAICNLKGRVQFGLWVRRLDDGFVLIVSDDLADEFIAHVKKYGAFSKITLSEPLFAKPIVMDNHATFHKEPDPSPTQVDPAWQKTSLMQGNYWITKSTSELFQPQELRLHQRGGVAYDKGCYLGQEIVARLWFKASPKVFLHLVALYEPARASDKVGKVGVVNIYDNLALVVGSPDEVAKIGDIIALPEPLNQSVARG